jgi:hypothetical protein
MFIGVTNVLISGVVGAIERVNPISYLYATDGVDMYVLGYGVLI